MSQYGRHYTREEANALLPQIRRWLTQMLSLREEQNRYGKRISGLLAQGHDLGGESVNRLVTALGRFNQVLREFQSREIQIKDLGRGLIDFPSIIGGREVFLCWEQGEEMVEFWHEIEGGFAGRERL